MGHALSLSKNVAPSSDYTLILLESTNAGIWAFYCNDSPIARSRDIKWDTPHLELLLIKLRIYAHLPMPSRRIWIIHMWPTRGVHESTFPQGDIHMSTLILMWSLHSPVGNPHNFHTSPHIYPHPPVDCREVFLQKAPILPGIITYQLIIITIILHSYGTWGRTFLY